MATHDPTLYGIGEKFTFHGRRYLVLRKGRSVLAALRAVDQQSPGDDARVIGAWQHRRRFRSALVEPPLVLLMFLVEHVTQPAALRTAIWLLGRCHRTVGVKSIAAHRNHPIDRVRREVVRALRRTGAADILASISAHDPDAALRRWARAEVTLPIEERIARFSQLIQRVPVPCLRPHSTRFFAIRATSGRPPRTPEQIRLHLERLRKNPP